MSDLVWHTTLEEAANLAGSDRPILIQFEAPG